MGAVSSTTNMERAWETRWAKAWKTATSSVQGEARSSRRARGLPRRAARPCGAGSSPRTPGSPRADQSRLTSRWRTPRRGWRPRGPPNPWCSGGRGGLGRRSRGDGAGERRLPHAPLAHDENEAMPGAASSSTSRESVPSGEQRRLGGRQLREALRGPRRARSRSMPSMLKACSGTSSRGRPGAPGASAPARAGRPLRWPGRRDPRDRWHGRRH